MTLWITVILMIILMAFGAFRQILRYRREKQQLILATDYLGTFLTFCNGGGSDAEAYCWLVEQSELLQGILGRIGLMDFRRPFESGYQHNRPVILNFLPDVRAAFQGDIIAQRSFDSTFNAIDGCLRRYIGVQKEKIHREQQRLFNPAVWFGGGIAAILEFVLSIVAEAAGLPLQRRHDIVTGRVFSALSGAVSLITFLSAIITILVSWKEFLAVIWESIS